MRPDLYQRRETALQQGLQFFLGMWDASRSNRTLPADLEPRVRHYSESAYRQGFEDGRKAREEIGEERGYIMAEKDAQRKKQG